MSRSRTTPQQKAKGPSPEEVQAIASLHTREKFERNALLIEEKSTFSDLVRRVLDLPIRRSHSLPSIGVSSAESRQPVYAGPSSEAQQATYPANPRRGDTSYELKNPAELVRRDQMAWETYEVKARERRRNQRDGGSSGGPGADDSAAHSATRRTPSEEHGTAEPLTTDSVPTDANQFDDDALFAARNLRLVHARRRRAEGQQQPQKPQEKGEATPTSFPPLQNRSSTPQQGQLRSSTPQEALPRLPSPADSNRKVSQFLELVQALVRDEAFMRSSVALEEQAGRSHVERKFKLHGKVAYLKEEERKSDERRSSPPAPTPSSVKGASSTNSVASPQKGGTSAKPPQQQQQPRRTSAQDKPPLSPVAEHSSPPLVPSPKTPSAVVADRPSPPAVVLAYSPPKSNDQPMHSMAMALANAAASSPNAVQPLRPEVEKQRTSIQKEEMSGRSSLAASEDGARSALWEHHVSTVEHIKERSHRVHAHTEIATKSVGSVHQKSAAMVEAVKASHRRVLNTACQLIVDEEDLERDDIAGEWEESWDHQISDPFWFRLTTFLSADESRARGEISRKYDREFVRDTAALEKYMDLVKPLMEMHRLSLEELLKHSESAVSLLTTAACEQAVLSSAETAARQAVERAQSDVREKMLVHHERTPNLLHEGMQMLRAFSFTKAVSSTMELELLARQLVEIRAAQALLLILEQQHTDVEGNSQFVEWNRTATELFHHYAEKTRLLYHVVRFSSEERQLLALEAAWRAYYLHMETKLRYHTAAVETHLGLLLESVGDHEQYLKRELTSSKHELLHRSHEFKALPLEIQDAARRVRDRDATFDTFEVFDAAAYTPNDFAKLVDILKQTVQPLQRITIRCGSSHALGVYECNPACLELIDCGLEDIDASSLGFLEWLSDSSCRLEKLVLDSNDLTDLTIRKYLRVLKYKNHRITKVSVSENVDVPENLQHALAYLAELNQYTDDFKRLMIRAQENDVNLRSVDMSEFVAHQSRVDSKNKLQPMGDAAVRLICLSLQNNSYCTSVNVANLGFSENGARNLSTLIKTNRCVTKLDVSNNFMGIAGVAQLAQAASVAVQKPVIVFWNNFTVADVEKEEASYRRQISKFEEFQRGFVNAFTELSESRYLRLSQVYDKKQQTFAKYEAPYIRMKVLEERHEKERAEFCEDETVVRGLILDRFDDSQNKLKIYATQRIRDVERLSRERSSLLLFHSVVLEQEVERAQKVTLIEKILRKQALLDAEFCFHHLKTIDGQHESFVGFIKHHYAECVDYYLQSEAEVRKISELLARQPYAIREVVFTEKLKMMQRLDAPTPRVASVSDRSVAPAEMSHLLPNLYTSPPPASPALQPPPVMTLVPSPTRSTALNAHNASPPPAVPQQTQAVAQPSPVPRRPEPLAEAILTTTTTASTTVASPLPVAYPMTSPMRSAVSPSAHAKPKPVQINLGLPSTAALVVPQRRPSKERKMPSLDSLMTSREDFRKYDDDDYPVTDESIVLMHDIICQGGAPVDRVNLSYRSEHVNFHQSMPLIEEMSQHIEFLDLSGCGLNDAFIPAILRIIAHPESKLREMSIKDNPFSVKGLRTIVDALKDTHRNLEEVHLGHDDEAVQESSHVRKLRDLARFYLAMKGPRGGRFKKLLIDAEANESFLRVLDFSNTILTHRRRREQAQKKLRKTGRSKPVGAAAPGNSPPSSSYEEATGYGESDSPSGSDHRRGGGDSSGVDGIPGVPSLRDLDDIDEGLLSESAHDIPPPLDDEAVQLICYALASNTNVVHLSVRGNNITEAGGRRILKFLKDSKDTTALQWLDIRDNFIPDAVQQEIENVFVQYWARRFQQEVGQPEATARAALLASFQYDHAFVPISSSFVRVMRRFSEIESAWEASHCNVYDFFVAKGKMDLAVVDPEAEQRKAREIVAERFYEKARVYLMLLNFRSDRYLKSCAQKEQFLQEEVVMTQRMGKLILALDPSLQAVAVHIARNNRYVDTLDLSSTPHEPRCSDEVIQVMSGLMKSNTYVKEVSFANSGGYFNAHRSMPLIAEMGTRLETLDLTNCHLSDGHVGALAAMLANPDCTLETLVLDENYLSSVGARKLAKAVRQSSTLSCISMTRNSNLSVEDQKLIQFYCDLNKYTKEFKEVILRVEANDPSLTELVFDRKGNLDERSVFDDVSMRLLCAALPHNTHVERIFLQGNHVSDEGALCLLNLLKSKVNRSVYVVDLAGNDVSPALVDELSRLVLIRLGETIDATVLNPEDIARTILMQEDRSFFFWITRLKKHATEWNELASDCVAEKDREIQWSFNNAEVDFHVLQHERRLRKQILDEESMFADVTDYMHAAVVRGYQPIVLEYMRAIRRAYLTCQQEVEDLLDELDRQPNPELRHNALWILNNMRRIESLDLSSTVPSAFCEQEILCNGRTVDIALQMLSKNKTVKKFSVANNAGRIPGWGDIWKLGTRLESLNVARCAITDTEIPQIVQMISGPNCTLRELILDGNFFSELGCADLLRTMRHLMETRPDFKLAKLSIQDCPHVSENLISTLDFLSELMRCPAAFRNLMMKLRFGIDPITVVDAQAMEINDDQCKLLCMALKPHKTVRAIKLRRNRITDIGVDYLCRLVKATPSIEHVDVNENDISSIARRQLASILEDRLGNRLGNDVQMPEEFHREDIIYEENMIPKFFTYYNRLTPHVYQHLQRVVDLYVNYGGNIWGRPAVFIPENEARKGVVEALELQQRLLLYKWMQYHQWLVNFSDRTVKQKRQWITEGQSAIRELAQLVAAHPSRELREKAFKIALNHPTALSLALLQQCDENAVVILGKVFKGNTQCRELNLSGNHQIKPSWVLPLIAEAGTDLEVLNLSDCNLRDGDIADPLRQLLSAPNCKLKKVILDRNFLTHQGVQRVLPVLRETNHVLVELSLKHNPEIARTPTHYLDFCLELNKYISVGHEHGKREDYLRIKSLLVDVEANRPDIRTLNFVNDEYALLMLDDQFAKLVCIALAHNTHVRTLYIRGHQISDAGAEYILKLLQGPNRTLDFVDLHGNFVSDSMLLALEYAIPWRHYAADLDRLLQAAVEAFSQAYNQYEAYVYSCRRDHQLMIIRPCFDARAEIEKDEDTVYRKLLSRFPDLLRFCDAWHKSYKYAFQRTYLQAEETLPLDVSTIDRRLSRTVVEAFSPKKADGASKLLDAVASLKAQLLPDFLRQKYLKFVSLTDLYEQKCVSALQKVFTTCAPVPAAEAESFLTNAYSPARLQSIFVPPSTADSSSKLRQLASSERLRRAVSPTVSIRDARSTAPKSAISSNTTSPKVDDLAASMSFGNRVKSFVLSSKSPEEANPFRAEPPAALRSTSFDLGDSGNPFGANLGPRLSLTNVSDTFSPSPSKSFLRSSSSAHFSSSQFADISGIDEEKLLLKLVSRYERLHEQVLTYEQKCAQLIQSQFRLAANDLAFVGRNRKIHGPQCDERCICAITDTTVDAARKLFERLSGRFEKYVSQVANFEEVCQSTLNAAYDESRLAVIELKKLLLRRSQAEIDAARMLQAKLSSRYERYVATVQDFEAKCVTALQKAFDIHAAPVHRSIEDAVMKRQLVDERLAEAAELHHKLNQRYMRYESVMADFETRCRGAKERMVKPDLDALSRSITSRRDSVGSREQKRSVVFIDDDDPEAAPGALLTVKSFFSNPTKTNPAVVKLQTRFDKYKQQVDEFELQCAAAYEAMFLREKSKLETGTTASFRRSSSISAMSREQAAASDALSRAPSLRRVDSMAAIVSPDEKTEQALQLLPTQPLALQRVGRMIANNDPSVVSIDLSSVSDPKPVNDTTVGILFTLLRSNNQLKELNLANQGHHLTITSMKLLARLGRKLEKLDLSNGRLENQLLAPTICAMLSVPDCTITTLNLNNNKLTQDGMLQIMQAMRRSNTSLTTMTVQGNEAVDKASVSFMNFYCDLNKFVPVDAKFKPMVLGAESNDENVTEILLKNTGYVDDLAVRCLCVALARNTNVMVVNLSGNTISDKSVKHFVQLLKVNTTIGRLDLSANRFTQEGISQLRKAAADSKVQHFIV